MKIYEILSLSRSGHHTVVNWILQNTMGVQCDWTYKLTQLGTNGLFYLNEANHDIPFSFKYVQEKKDLVKKLYLNYEDTPGDYTLFNNEKSYKGPLSLSFPGIENTEFVGRVVIIRDFYNLLASRIKSNENKVLMKWDNNQHLLDVGEKCIYRWKSQVKSCLYNNTPYLKFEDWLNNKEVREKFLFDNFGLIDYFGIEGIKGTSSSFGNHNGVLNRINQVEIPDEIKQIINKDNELHYLMGRMGYSYREL